MQDQEAMDQSQHSSCTLLQGAAITEWVAYQTDRLLHDAWEISRVEALWLSSARQCSALWPN